MSVFSVFKQSKKNEKQEKEINLYEYYSALAKRTSFAKWLLIAALLGFVLYSFSYRGNDLSAENFRNLFSFFTVDTGSTALNKAQISYDYDTENRGASLRNAFAVCNKNGINIFDLNGSKLYSAICRYDAPMLVSNNKYFILYDLGGYELRIYSAYTFVKSLKFTYPIYSVVTNESGKIAVITSEKSYRSAFYVYDNYFRLIYSHYFGEQYLLSIALNDEGTNVSTACLMPSGTSYNTVVTEFSLKSDKIVNSFDVSGEYPLEINYASDNTISLLTDKTIRRYEGDKETGKIFFDKKDVSCYLFNDNYDIITYSSTSLNGNSSLTVYDSSGNNVYTSDFGKGILDIAVKGDMLYVLTYKSLFIIDLTSPENKRTAEVSEDITELLNTDKDYLFLVSPKKATIFFP